MAFHYFDFNSMRSFLYHCRGTIQEREARVGLFDLYRMAEDYETMYAMVTWYGGEIIYD